MAIESSKGAAKLPTQETKNAVEITVTAMLPHHDENQCPQADRNKCASKCEEEVPKVTQKASTIAKHLLVAVPHIRFPRRTRCAVRSARPDSTHQDIGVVKKVHGVDSVDTVVRRSSEGDGIYSIGIEEKESPLSTKNNTAMMGERPTMSREDTFSKPATQSIDKSGTTTAQVHEDAGEDQRSSAQPCKASITNKTNVQGDSANQLAAVCDGKIVANRAEKDATKTREYALHPSTASSGHNAAGMLILPSLRNFDRILCHDAEQVRHFVKELCVPGITYDEFGVCIEPHAPSWVRGRIARAVQLKVDSIKEGVQVSQSLDIQRERELEKTEKQFYGKETWWRALYLGRGGPRYYENAKEHGQTITGSTYASSEPVSFSERTESRSLIARNSFGNSFFDETRLSDWNAHGYRKDVDYGIDQPPTGPKRKWQKNKNWKKNKKSPHEDLVPEKRPLPFSQESPTPEITHDNKRAAAQSQSSGAASTHGLADDVLVQHTTKGDKKMSSRRPLCLYFQKGRCRFGKKCAFSHEKPDHIGMGQSAGTDPADSVHSLVAASSEGPSQGPKRKRSYWGDRQDGKPI